MRRILVTWDGNKKITMIWSLKSSYDMARKMKYCGGPLTTFQVEETGDRGLDGFYSYYVLSLASLTLSYELMFKL